MAWEDIPDWAASAAGSILEAVRAKDEFTFHHCCRVGRHARRLGKAMGLNEFEQSVLEFSGLFHDIGKVGLPDSVLTKPGRLEPEEVELMKSHPLMSAKIISHLEHTAFFRFILPGVRCHHEKIDGTGYPFGLKGEHIPLMARVVSVVDCFDAMTHSRPYRKALPVEVAKQELIDFGGTQFDAQLVKVFLSALPHWDKLVKDQKEELVVYRLVAA